MLLQFSAAVLAFRIGWLKGRRLAWSAIAVAILLMGIRRSVTLSRVILQDGVQPDLVAEAIALAISLLLVLGFWAIRPELRILRAAKERENLLGDILEDSLNEIYVFHAETLQFLQVNRGARENLGYSMEELRSITPVDLKPEFDLAAFEQAIEPLREGTSDVLHFSTEHRRKDGSLYPVEVNLQLSTTSLPHVFFAIIADVSARHRRDAELRRLEVALEQADEGITILDNECKIEYANPSFAALMQQPRQRLIGTIIDDLAVGDAVEMPFGEVARSLRAGNTWRGRLTLETKEATSILDTTFGTFRDEENSTRGFVGVVRNITREVGLERELKNPPAVHGHRVRLSAA